MMAARRASDILASLRLSSLISLFLSLSFSPECLLRSFFHTLSFSLLFYISNFIFPGLNLFYFAYDYYSTHARARAHTHTHTHTQPGIFVSLLTYRLTCDSVYFAPAIIYILFPLTVLEEFDLRIVNGFFLPLVLFISFSLAMFISDRNTMRERSWRCTYLEKKKISRPWRTMLLEQKNSN